MISRDIENGESQWLDERNKNKLSTLFFDCSLNFSSKERNIALEKKIKLKYYGTKTKTLTQRHIDLRHNKIDIVGKHQVFLHIN